MPCVSVMEAATYIFMFCFAIVATVLFTAWRTKNLGIILGFMVLVMALFAPIVAYLVGS